MICGKIDEAKTYFAQDERFEKLFNVMKNIPCDIEAGTIVDFGNGISGKIADITTGDKSVRRYESHRKFIDIHYIICGEEIFGYSSISDASGSTGYDGDKDIEFYEGMADEALLHLRAGNFCITYPEDLHKPCCSVTPGNKVKRIVAKVPVK